jgi:hypothetical protein
MPLYMLFCRYHFRGKSSQRSALSPRNCPQKRSVSAELFSVELSPRKLLGDVASSIDRVVTDDRRKTARKQTFQC